MGRSSDGLHNTSSGLASDADSGTDECSDSPIGGHRCKNGAASNTARGYPVRGLPGDDPCFSFGPCPTGWWHHLQPRTEWLRHQNLVRCQDAGKHHKGSAGFEATHLEEDCSHRKRVLGCWHKAADNGVCAQEASFKYEGVACAATTCSGTSCGGSLRQDCHWQEGAFSPIRAW